MVRWKSSGFPEASPAFRLDAYRYISRHCDKVGADAFRTRLLLSPAICLRGPEAAEMFYGEGRFTRRGAMPGFIAHVLFGEGGVQMLDGAEHSPRKAMLMSLMSPARIDALGERFRTALLGRVPIWRDGQPREMLPEFERAMGDAVLGWAGLDPGPAGHRTELLDAMARLFQRAAALGPDYLRARADRRWLDRWAAGRIRAVRDGQLDAPEEAAVSVIANWRDPGGERLPEEVAGVELLNVLRPTVAVGIWLVFQLHALATGAARPGTAEARRRFGIEVRRLYPFFPIIGGIARETFDWQGKRVPAGTRVLLEVRGTNRHPGTWRDPDRFDPGRFDGAAPGPFDMIPQGGGSFDAGHRCAGEWITERLMDVALEVFVDRLDWRVPRQELEFDMRAIPALPKDGFRLEAIRAK